MKLEPSLRSSSLLLTAATIIGVVLMAMSGLSYFKSIGVSNRTDAVSNVNRQLQYRYAEFYPESRSPGKSEHPTDNVVSGSKQNVDTAEGTRSQPVALSDLAEHEASTAVSGAVQTGTQGQATLTQSSGINAGQKQVVSGSTGTQHYVTAEWTTTPAVGSPQVSVPVTINVNNGDLFSELLQLHRRIEDLQSQKNSQVQNRRMPEGNLATPKYQFFSYTVHNVNDPSIQNAPALAETKSAAAEVASQSAEPVSVVATQNSRSQIQATPPETEHRPVKRSIKSATATASSLRTENRHATASISESRTSSKSSSQIAVVRLSEFQAAESVPSADHTRSDHDSESQSSAQHVASVETNGEALFNVFEDSLSVDEQPTATTEHAELFAEENESEIDFGSIEPISYQFSSDEESSSASTSAAAFDSGQDFTEFEQSEEFHGFEPVEPQLTTAESIVTESTFEAPGDVPEIPDLAFEDDSELLSVPQTQRLAGGQIEVVENADSRLPIRIGHSLEPEFKHAEAPSISEPVEFPDFLELPAPDLSAVEQHTSPAPIENSPRRKVDATTFAKLAHLPPENLFGDPVNNVTNRSDSYDSLNTLNNFAPHISRPVPLTSIPSIPSIPQLAFSESTNDESRPEVFVNEPVSALPPLSIPDTTPETVTFQNVATPSLTPIRSISSAADRAPSAAPSNFAQENSASTVTQPNSDRVRRFEQEQQKKRAASLARSKASAGHQQKKATQGSKLPQFTTFRRINKQVATAASSFRLPSFDLPDPPDIQLPDVDFPSMRMPEFKAPKLAMSDLPRPDIRLPDIDFPDLQRPIPQVPQPQVPQPQTASPLAHSPGCRLHSAQETRKQWRFPKFSMPQFSLHTQQDLECECCKQTAGVVSPITESPLVHRMISTVQFAGQSKAVE